MTRTTICMTCSLALTAGAVWAEGHGAKHFNRIASFPVVTNMAAGEDTSRETSPEIIDVTADGMTLVYTDSPLEALGRIDITDPANPKPLGNIALDGEPTSVVVPAAHAIVGVNTSASYTEPSGYIASIDVASGAEANRCDLGGQPDSVAVAPDNAFVAVAIENERDEDLGDGRTGQLPGGFLVMVGLTEDGVLDCDTLSSVDLAGLAEVSPEDPEPEYVSINSLGETVVTLQENNHLVVVSRDGTALSHFSAGAVDLDNIDATDERAALIFDESQPGRLREPDAVTWIDDTHFATANEGDMDGGSRGWTIFNKDGTIIYESGVSFEHAMVQIGHYPDRRSDAKGVEPESVTFDVFDGTPYVFVGSERGSIVGVYDVTDPAAPVLKQMLPSGIGPEGYVTIPERGLLVSANEYDGLEDGAARAHVMLFAYGEGDPVYPHLTSEGMDTLTGWGAISGMVADGDFIWAVNDSFYGFQPTIFRIDPSTTPARIVEAPAAKSGSGQVRSRCRPSSWRSSGALALRGSRASATRCGWPYSASGRTTRKTTSSWWRMIWRPKTGVPCTIPRPHRPRAGSACRKSWRMATLSMSSSGTTSTISKRSPKRSIAFRWPKWCLLHSGVTCLWCARNWSAICCQT